MLQHFELVHVVFLSLILICAGWTAPKARWPKEWITYTNITRANNNQPNDYGCQIYSWSNRAQSVLHSDMFRAGHASTLLWRDNRSYTIWNNYNSCCYLSQFEFPMPNVNWTDFLTYERNDTFNGVPSYLYVNASLMDVKYWVSIETGLPVGWSNVPNATFNPNPIIQYFYASVEYDVPLSADYFTLPLACVNAPSCPILNHTSDDDDGGGGGDNSDSSSCPKSSDKMEVELEAALVVVPIIVLMVGLGMGFLGGKYLYEPKPNSTNINNNVVMKSEDKGGTRSRNRNKDDDRESMNPMNPSSAIELLARDGRSDL